MFFCNASIILLRLHIFLLQLLLSLIEGVKPKTTYKVRALSTCTGMGGGAGDWSVEATGSDRVSGEQTDSEGRDVLGPKRLNDMKAPNPI
jgi:hypothetical protein